MKSSQAKSSELMDTKLLRGGKPREEEQVKRPARAI